MTDDAEGVIDEQVADVQQDLTDKEINFRALRDKMEHLAQENQMLQAKFYEQERMKQQQSPQYREDDIPTWGDVNKVRQQDKQELNQIKEMLQDLTMKTKYADYDKTVKEYLPDVLKEDPELALAIKDNPLVHRLAYKLAQASPRYHQERLSQQNEETVDRIVKNASRAQPAPARKSVLVQDEDARLGSMSDQDIMGIFNMAKARY